MAKDEETKKREAAKMNALTRASDLLAPLPAEDAERILLALWEMYSSNPRGR